jgi:Asp-tRNA(Asn)/Glu-tRNA(Gln) amidotransferase B subunit
LSLCQTGRVWASRPAKKSGRSVKEKKNSNANVMYICVVLPGIEPGLSSSPVTKIMYRFIGVLLKYEKKRNL